VGTALHRTIPVVSPTPRLAYSGKSRSVRPEVRAAIAPAPGPDLRCVRERHEEGASLVDELLLLGRGQLGQATELALRRKDVVGPGGASVHDGQRHRRQQRQEDEQRHAGAKPEESTTKPPSFHVPGIVTCEEAL
jgi:hypothetical protein